MFSRKNLKTILAIAALAVLAAFACCMIADSEDSDAAVSGTPGSTVSLTWHTLDEDMDVSRFVKIDSIFGWEESPTVTKSGSNARITIPANAANGTYTYIESCVNPENGDEIDYYSQTFTVTGQKGTSTSNPYTGSVASPSSVGCYQNLSKTVYVSAGSSVDIKFLQWNRESKDTLTVTSGSGLSISTVNSYTKKVSGSLSSDATITAKTWDTNAYKTVTITLKSVGSQSSEYTCYLYYNANGGSDAPSTQSYTGTSTSNHSFTVASGTPTRSGYDFLGWSTSSSATSASYSSGDPISVSYNGSKTLYAVWQEKVTSYSITVYKGNWYSFKWVGGSDSTTYTTTSHTYTVASGTSFDIDWYGKSSESGSGTGYTYTTTYSSSNYNMATSQYGTSLGDSVTITKTAKYYPAVQMTSETVYTYSYTIKYNANGGSGAPGNTTGTSSSTTKSMTLASTTPTRSGYTFQGWSESSTATSATYSAGGTYSFDYGTTNLYAVWKQSSLTIGSVSKQYAVVGQGVSFTATCSPSNVSVSYAKSNASSGLTVSISGSTITCNASVAGTYTFTLTASASGYSSSSTTVTVQFVPVLAFTNAPSIGVIGS
ncbi:MAG: hypothetical protein E7Z70_01820 [Thermoplasmata archaeon]|nr:hypothetical protein [Thermoplasmata archaeon]